MSAVAEQWPGDHLFDLAPRPGWVDHKALSVDELSRAHDAPLHFLFLSYQDNVEDHQIQRHSHRVYQVNDASQIESNSQSLEDLSPDSERIRFHICRIFREGTFIDCLSHDRIRAVQREKDLERQVASDRVTVELLIDDLRVGDVVEIESTVTTFSGEHALHGRFYHSVKWLTWGIPVSAQVCRVINNSTRDISLQRRDSSKNINKSSILSPGHTESVVLDSIEPDRSISHLPPWYWHNVLIGTTTQGWADVSAYLHAQNSLHKVLEVDLSHEEIASIGDVNWTQPNTESLTQVVRFVQDNIRYRAESNGIHTHTPKRVSETLRRRTGDCKDKSALLVVLLQRMGIDARLALVNTQLKDDVTQLNPSAYWFNHMVIQFDFEGTTFTVDPTLQKQGGSILTQTQPDFRICLPITHSGAELTPVPRESDLLLFEKRHEIDLRFNTLDQCTLHVTRTFYHERADNMRFYLASRQKAELEDDYLAYAMDDFNLNMIIVRGLEIVEDDQANNVLRTEERYQLQGSIEELEHRTIGFTSDLHEDFKMTKRDTHPVTTTSTGQWSHEVTVHYGNTPEKINDQFSEKNAFFEYEDVLRTEGKSVVCSTRFKALVDSVCAADVAECRTAVAKVHNRCRTNVPLNLYLEQATELKDHLWYIIVLVYCVLKLGNQRFDFEQYPVLLILTAALPLILAIGLYMKWIRFPTISWPNFKWPNLKP